MQTVRHFPAPSPIDRDCAAAGIATADIEVRELKPAPYNPRGAEFRHIRFKRRVDRALLALTLVIGGFAVLFMLSGALLTVADVMGVRL